MKYGIALLGNRISPRCTTADSILFATQINGKTAVQKGISINTADLNEFCEILIQNRVDILICGGLTDSNKDLLRSKNISIIENVIGTADQIIYALETGQIKSGFGIKKFCSDIGREDYIAASNSEMISPLIDPQFNDQEKSFDCIKCCNRVCLTGQPCNKLFDDIGDCPKTPSREAMRMLNAAIDIDCERERTLCRLSELIYFCLEMQYQHLGIAFCTDLEEPTETLVRVLRRFFTVYPVCCKVGGLANIDSELSEAEPNKHQSSSPVHCNPIGQARIMNCLETDLNVMVGLCMGADCVFSQNSKAPTTALFVKDRSLANNPIGAVYSEYYLKEATRMSS